MSTDVLALIKCGIGAAQARQFAPFMDSTFERFAVDSLEGRAAFIAQARHESVNFTRLEESMYYSSVARMKAVFKRLRDIPDGRLNQFVGQPEAFADFVYANVNGNGPEISGDGWTYRGRGLAQLTGRANYIMAMMACDQPYYEHPELLLKPEHAVLSFGAFWQSRDLNNAMKRGGIDLVSERIVGDDRTNDERRALYQECLDGLGSH